MAAPMAPSAPTPLADAVVADGSPIVVPATYEALYADAVRSAAEAPRDIIPITPDRFHARFLPFLRWAADSRGGVNVLTLSILEARRLFLEFVMEFNGRKLSAEYYAERVEASSGGERRNVLATDPPNYTAFLDHSDGPGSLPDGPVGNDGPMSFAAAAAQTSRVLAGHYNGWGFAARMTPGQREEIAAAVRESRRVTNDVAWSDFAERLPPR